MIYLINLKPANNDLNVFQIVNVRICIFSGLSRPIRVRSTLNCFERLQLHLNLQLSCDILLQYLNFRHGIEGMG